MAANEIIMDDVWGCYQCFRGNAPYAWKKRVFAHVAGLVGESHFSITIVACKRCGQKCVKVFMEDVDWVNSDDAQMWVVVPLTEEQTAELIGQGEAVSTKAIEEMSAGRRYLVADFPTGGGERIEWCVGPAGILRR